MNGPSYSELIRVGSEKLRDAGISEARHEARLLMLLASDLSAAELISRDVETAAPDHRAAFDMFVRMRKSRKPYAHISGWVEFRGLSLKSDHRALIPRTDSEIVADLAIDLIPDDAAWRLADLGTGTGALLAAILTARSRTRGVAVEASADALHLAADNFDSLGLSGRSQLFLGPWSQWTGWEVCDLIICNPPYIRSTVIPALAPEVRDHDPMEALDGGVDGLSAYREIIALGAQHMKPGAHLVLEIGFDQKTAVSALLTANGFSDLQHRQDLGGHDRAIAATKT